MSGHCADVDWIVNQPRQNFFQSAIITGIRGVVLLAKSTRVDRASGAVIASNTQLKSYNMLSLFNHVQTRSQAMAALSIAHVSSHREHQQYRRLCCPNAAELE